MAIGAVLLALGGFAASALATRSAASSLTVAATTDTTGTETTAAQQTTTETTTEATTETTTEATTTQVTITVTPTATTVPATTTTGESNSSSTPWGWIALGIALAAAAVVGIFLWARSRSRASSWSSRADDLGVRTLVALDDVRAQGSVVTGHVQALAAEARSLEANAPDDRQRARVGRLRAGLDGLARALEEDRTLRLSSPPPSEEQIAYSGSVVRRQAEELQAMLRPPASPG